MIQKKKLIYPAPFGDTHDASLTVLQHILSIYLDGHSQQLRSRVGCDDSGGTAGRVTASHRLLISPGGFEGFYTPCPLKSAYNLLHWAFWLGMGFTTRHKNVDAVEWVTASIGLIRHKL